MAFNLIHVFTWKTHFGLHRSFKNWTNKLNIFNFQIDAFHVIVICCCCYFLFVCLKGTIMMKKKWCLKWKMYIENYEKSEEKVTRTSSSDCSSISQWRRCAAFVTPQLWMSICSIKRERCTLYKYHPHHLSIEWNGMCSTYIDDKAINRLEYVAKELNTVEHQCIIIYIQPIVYPFK